jgi:DNA-binding NarL/FixJ family response regulator
MSRYRILLVDDSPAFLESARRLLATYPELEVVGHAMSAQEAIEKVAELDPDLVLMDISMPGMDGLEATRRIKSQQNPPRIILVTLHDWAAYRNAARSAQADSFVAKSELGSQLVPIIHNLLDGPS